MVFVIALQELAEVPVTPLATENAVVPPLGIPPAGVYTHPAMANEEVVGVPAPLSRNIMLAEVQSVPVAWPTEAVNVPECRSGLEHTYPVRETHSVPRNVALLKTFSENNAASTIAIMRMAQP